MFTQIQKEYGPGVEKAICIALNAHKRQKDKAGKPYILHPLRVMLRFKGVDEMITAVLHDTVEDSDVTIEDLRKAGFSEEILEAVSSLTRRAGEPYNEFILRAGKNPIARRVKIADIEDNMDINRMNSLGEKELARIKRYHIAWKHLNGEDKGAYPG